jgi:hypothetical protein
MPSSSGRHRLVIAAPIVSICGLHLGLGIHSAFGQEESGDEPALPPHLQRIQQELGGPAVNRFPSLSTKPERSPSRLQSVAASRNVQRQAVETLRDAAWQLDVAANRLERLELYGLADRLREQAQQLRLDARHMITGEERIGAPAAIRSLRPISEPAPIEAGALEPQPKAD